MITNTKAGSWYDATATPLNSLVAHCITFRGIRPQANGPTRLVGRPIWRRRGNCLMKISNTRPILCSVIYDLITVYTPNESHPLYSANCCSKKEKKPTAAQSKTFFRSFLTTSLSNQRQPSLILCPRQCRESRICCPLPCSHLIPMNRHLLYYCSDVHLWNA